MGYYFSNFEKIKCKNCKGKKFVFAYIGVREDLHIARARCDRCGCTTDTSFGWADPKKHPVGALEAGGYELVIKKRPADAISNIDQSDYWNPRWATEDDDQSFRNFLTDLGPKPE